MIGNPGNDTFVFSSGGGNDIIADFEPGDRLELHAAGPGQIGMVPHLSKSALVMGYNSERHASPSTIWFQGLEAEDHHWVRDSFLFA